MNKMSQNIVALEKAVLQLSDNPGFKNAQLVINSVIKLLGISADDKWKLFSDSNGKIRSNSGWFMLADGFADKRAAYKIADDNDSNFDLKAYWMKNISKVVISWLVALTPNFEDEPFYKQKNIGIDFVITEKADRVIVVLSSNYVIRTLELSQSLSLTQKEIFHKWIQDFDFANKAQVHENLWNSFDLESVNKTFYKEISSFFVELKQHLVDKKIFDERHAALFVNRFIGRVIFCWFLDKKDFINPKQKYFDLEGKNATEYYQLKLEKLFFRILNKKIKDRAEDVYNLVGEIDEETPFLNGGLFTPREDDYFGVKHITFPADYFDRLYTFLKHYNFTTDESTSSFQQVAIDPEMLGRIFENLLAEQVEETGEQARKAKGAFYTPREIVEYMCKESLREYLKSKIEKTDDSEQRISQLLDSKPHEWRDQQRNYREKLKKYKYEILEALDEIKVVDPACGSGAFPMGMLQLLLQTYERLDPTFDPYKKKLEIIKNNLFGVDIEPMAVEIARLRSWLSIIVDEELNPKAENMGIHPLPNLEFKFVCANSLIPAPVEEDGGMFEDPFFEELEQKAKEFFEINDVEKKEAKKHELHELVGCKVKEKLDNAGQLSTGLNMGKFEGELKKKNQKAIDENMKLFHLWSSYTNIFTADEPAGFFETKYFFPSAKEGFDVVIGNPPYGADIDKFVKIYGDLYPETSKGFKDIYKYFFNRSILICKLKGVVCFITPNTYLLQPRYRDLRKFLLKFNIKEIIDLGDKVFKEVVVYTAISLIKNDFEKGEEIIFWDLSKENDYKKYMGIVEKSKTIKQSIFENTPSNIFSFNVKIKNNDEENLEDILDMKDAGFKYQRINVGLSEKGKNDLAERIFYTGKKVNGNDIPILIGKNLSRTGYGLDSEISKKLKFNYRTYLRENEKTYFNKEIMSSKRKLIWRQTAPFFIGTILGDDIFFGNTIQAGIIRKEWLEVISYEYLCGLMNSKYLRFLYEQNVKEAGKVFPQIKLEKLRSIPIKIPTSENQNLAKKIGSLVSQIIITKKENPKTNTFSIEAEIDQLVYKLYKLTPEEIQVIEDQS
jgi:hypothetical protein